MDLKNGAITVKEVLANPKAMEVLRKYFPQVAGNRLLLGVAKSWTLNQVMNRAGDRLDEQTKKKIRKELEEL